MRLLIAALALAASALANRSTCCFTLHDTTEGSSLAAAEAPNGLVHLTHQSGARFCLRSTEGPTFLVDGRGNYCGLDQYNRLRCLRGPPGRQAWDTVQTPDYLALSYNRDTNFGACATNHQELLQLFGHGEGPLPPCDRTVQLRVQYIEGTC